MRKMGLEKWGIRPKLSHFSPIFSYFLPVFTHFFYISLIYAWPCLTNPPPPHFPSFTPIFSHCAAIFPFPPFF